MDLYPLDLVLATALAWVTIFIGALPTRLLRPHFFTRLTAYCGIAWFVVACLVPPSVTHYYVLLGLLCLYAWWQLRRDNALRGKGWLIAAAGLGISLGVVLILAETSGAYPEGMPVGEQAVRLAPVYSGGAIVGLALILYFFTRREATRVGIPANTVRRYATLLVAFSLVRCLISVFIALSSGAMNPPPAPLREEFIGSTFPAWAKDATFLSSILLLPALAVLARRFAISPAPSRGAPCFVAVALVGLATEILFLFFSSLSS